MPPLRCTSCGEITNTIVSNYISNTEVDGITPKKSGIVTNCYAAFVNGKWVKGCSYEHATPRKKKLVDSLIQQ
jgi:hypothetical protein